MHTRCCYEEGERLVTEDQTLKCTFFYSATKTAAIPTKVRIMIEMYDTRRTHSGSNTHAGNTNFLASSLQLGKKCADLASACAAERVCLALEEITTVVNRRLTSERYGTTLWVDLGHVKVESSAGHQCLTRKARKSSVMLSNLQQFRDIRFVDLENVDIVSCDVCFLEHSWDGVCWSHTHDSRWHTNDGGVTEFANDIQSECLGLGTLHEQNGCGTIRNLGGVTCVRGTIFGESWPELLKRLECGPRADSVILGDDDSLVLSGLWVREGGFDGNDLLVEETCLLSSLCTTVRLGGKSVLILAGDVVFFGDVLGRDSHGKRAVRCFLVFLASIGYGASSGSAVVGSHTFCAGTDTDLNHARLDLVSDLDDCLES